MPLTFQVVSLMMAKTTATTTVATEEGATTNSIQSYLKSGMSMYYTILLTCCVFNLSATGNACWRWKTCLR